MADVGRFGHAVVIRACAIAVRASKERPREQRHVKEDSWIAEDQRRLQPRPTISVISQKTEEHNEHLLAISRWWYWGAREWGSTKVTSTHDDTISAVNVGAVGSSHAHVWAALNGSVPTNLVEVARKTACKAHTCFAERIGVARFEGGGAPRHKCRVDQTQVGRRSRYGRRSRTRVYRRSRLLGLVHCRHPIGRRARRAHSASARRPGATHSEHTVLKGQGPGW